MPGPDPIRPIHGKDNNYESVLDRLYDILNKGLGKGGLSADGTTEQPGHTDNRHVRVTTPGVANTEFAVTHNLNRIPTGYNVVLLTAAAHVYIGPTPWTTTQIFLKCDQIGVILNLEIY